METSSKYYKPVWEFIANIINNSNEFFLSTAIVPKERFSVEFQSLKTHLFNDLAGSASFQFQQIAPLLDDIEKSNKPHRLFRKTVWVNKSKIAKQLDQIIALVPQSLWTEIESIDVEAPPEEPAIEESKIKSVVNKVLDGALIFIGVVFIYVNIAFGTQSDRQRGIILAIMGGIALLRNVGVIKEKWIDGAGWVLFAMMCIGGPLFTIYFVGNYYGWW